MSTQDTQCVGKGEEADMGTAFVVVRIYQNVLLTTREGGTICHDLKSG